MLLSLSRAARLAGVTRAELQRRIRQGELTTFEGDIDVADLLRVYPSVTLEKTGKLEQVERIKADALPRSHDGDTALPSPEVLVARIRSLGKALARKAAQADAQAALLDELRTRLAEADQPGTDELLGWLDARRAEIDTLPAEDSRARLLAKDTFLRIMSANVKIIPSGHEFFVDGTESILEAAVRAGLRLGYGCASGNCGECKARVVSGEVPHAASTTTCSPSARSRWATCSPAATRPSPTWCWRHRRRAPSPTCRNRTSAPRSASWSPRARTCCCCTCRRRAPRRCASWPASGRC
jgi:CDP-4-dehydro-6-deoxyglucose reductase